MPQRRDPVPRARAWVHWLGGILLLGVLGGGVVAAAVLLWENLDIRQLAPALARHPGAPPEPLAPLAPAVDLRGFSAVVLISPSNRAFFPDSTYYPQAVGAWKSIVEAVGGDVREIHSLVGPDGPEPEELLILPEAPCLARAEVRAVESHLSRGGSLVSNWAVGARDENCEWRSWNAVRDLTAAGDVREIPARPALYLTVPGGTPLSPGLDPGTRIELRPEPSLALNQPGARVFWSDWALNPAPDESGGGADVAASAVRTEGGGRTVWFGFRLSQAVTSRDSMRLERLVRNGILWAAGTPLAIPSTWPGGKRAALLLVEDVEAEFQNSRAMAELLDSLGVAGSFYAVSQMVLEDPELAAVLTRGGEVGSQTSDHTPVAGLGYRDQRVRLRRSWVEIRGWTGKAPGGLRPPEEVFDKNTLEAWHSAGGEYVLAVNQARSASPELHGVGDGRIVLIPRLMKDDYNVFVQEGALRTERLTEAFLEGIGKLRALGGVAVAAVHTQIVGTDRRLNAIRAVVDTAKVQGDWWMTTAGDVARWWESRSQVRLSFVPSGSPSEPGGEPMAVADMEPPGPVPVIRGGEILVEGPEINPIQDLWVDLVLPAGRGDWVPLVDGVPVDFSVTEWGMRVPVGVLEPGRSRRITLREAPPSEEGASQD